MSARPAVGAAGPRRGDLTDAFASFGAAMPASERALRPGPAAALPAPARSRPMRAPATGSVTVCAGSRIERRRDAVVSRRRWQFGLRDTADPQDPRGRGHERPLAEPRQAQARGARHSPRPGSFCRPTRRPGREPPTACSGRCSRTRRAPARLSVARAEPGRASCPGRASFLVLSARAPADRQDLFDLETKPFAPALNPATVSASPCAPIRSSPGPTRAPAGRGATTW